MNLIGVFLVNLLLLSSCLSANVNRTSSADEVNQRENQTGIDGDFVYSMFEQTALDDDILKLVKNPRYSAFIKKIVFPAKYRNYDFNVIGDSDNHLEGFFIAFDTAVQMHGHRMNLDTIKTIGGSIKNLHIFESDEQSDERSTEIGQYVNEFCTKSLISFTLCTYNENLLSLFTTPFQRLEKLKLIFKTNQIGSIRPLSETFPKIRKLSLGFYAAAVDNEYIETKLPHLEYLKLEVGLMNETDLGKVYKQFGSIIEKNPQISSFAYTGHAPLFADFMGVIKKNLQNLERFTINGLDADIQSVQFDRVKYFKVRSAVEAPFEKLTFPKLNSLRFVYSAKTRESWTKFFCNHQGIKEMYGSLIDSEGFVELTRELPNLNVIRINLNGAFDIDFVSKLVESHKNLIKLEFEAFAFHQPNAPDMADYHERFDNEWDINYVHHIHWRKITLEKKY